MYGGNHNVTQSQDRAVGCLTLGLKLLAPLRHTILQGEIGTGEQIPRLPTGALEEK